MCGWHSVTLQKQYIGNPYVWGGTSLTKGSGLFRIRTFCIPEIMVSVFRIHPVRRRTVEPRSVCLSWKPGDLVFYGNRSGINHVAIYVGGGQVVHASNPRVGYHDLWCKLS